MVLNKLEQPVDDWLRFPEHASALTTFFQTHTNSRHFLTPTPYTRWFKRMWHLSGDRVSAALMKDGKKAA